MGTCWKNVPGNSVFEITGISKTEQFNLYNSGIRTIDQIPLHNELNANVNLHISSVKTGEAIVNKELLQKFFAKLQYPLYFMDFETFMPAIPLFEGTRPYQHIPFQYSIHLKENPDADAKQFEFLAETGSDPRKSFVESLLAASAGTGSILVYDSLMERNVLNALKKDFPEHAKEIDNRLSRIVDLMQPFQEKAYYHPAMKNSFSMKNVLPAMVSGETYSKLTISSGSIAMIAFEQLQTETDMFRALEIRDQLLEYCRMDTYAMLRVFEIIEQSAKD
jgi:hypothetical protein